MIYIGCCGAYCGRLVASEEGPPTARIGSVLNEYEAYCTDARLVRLPRYIQVPYDPLTLWQFRMKMSPLECVCSGDEDGDALNPEVEVLIRAEDELFTVMVDMEALAELDSFIFPVTRGTAKPNSSCNAPKANGA